jgi:hypothetical protein
MADQDAEADEIGSARPGRPPLIGDDEAIKLAQRKFAPLAGGGAMVDDTALAAELTPVLRAAGELSADKSVHPKMIQRAVARAFKLGLVRIAAPGRDEVQYDDAFRDRLRQAFPNAKRLKRVVVVPVRGGSDEAHDEVGAAMAREFHKISPWLHRARAKNAIAISSGRFCHAFVDNLPVQTGLEHVTVVNLSGSVFKQQTFGGASPDAARTRPIDAQLDSDTLMTNLATKIYEGGAEVRTEPILGGAAVDDPAERLRRLREFGLQALLDRRSPDLRRQLQGLVPGPLLAETEGSEKELKSQLALLKESLSELYGAGEPNERIERLRGLGLGPLLAGAEPLDRLRELVGLGLDELIVAIGGRIHAVSVAGLGHFASLHRAFRAAGRYTDDGGFAPKPEEEVDRILHPVAGPLIALATKVHRLMRTYNTHSSVFDIANRFFVVRPYLDRNGKEVVMTDEDEKLFTTNKSRTFEAWDAELAQQKPSGHRSAAAGESSDWTGEDWSIHDLVKVINSRMITVTKTVLARTDLWLGVASDELPDKADGVFEIFKRTDADYLENADPFHKEGSLDLISTLFIDQAVRERMELLLEAHERSRAGAG